MADTSQDDLDTSQASAADVSAADVSAADASAAGADAAEASSATSEAAAGNRRGLREVGGEAVWSLSTANRQRR